VASLEETQGLLSRFDSVYLGYITQGGAGVALAGCYEPTCQVLLFPYTDGSTAYTVLGLGQEFSEYSALPRGCGEQERLTQGGPSFEPQLGALESRPKKRKEKKRKENQTKRGVIARHSC